MNQGTQEWLDARAGHVTASVFKDMLSQIKVGESASRRNLRMRLVTERLTGIPCEGYTNAAMLYGIEMEPYARTAYEVETGHFVEQVGFIKHPTVEWCGASPDGLIGEDGCFEAKCPHQSTVHVETLQGGMPSEHVAQCQGVMWVCNRQWCDFVSFDPRMPERLRLYTQRVERDEAYIATLAEKVTAFLAEVDKLHQYLLRT